MSRSSRRGPWLPEEDAVLLHLVHTQGPNNWVRISQHMQHRSPKQCRERYHQNLKPTLNHEPISAEEGELIEQLVDEIGKRWAEIARRLGNRSDNAVKNWWNGSMNRRKRNKLHQTGEAGVVGYRTLPIPASAPPRPPYTHEPSMPVPHPLGYPSPTPPSMRPLGAHQHNYDFTDTRPMGPTADYDPTRSRTERNILDHSQSSSRTYSSLSLERVHYRNFQTRQAEPEPCRPTEPISQKRPFFARSWSADRAEWQLPPLYPTEPPIHSPAATESSQASLNQQAPSLVSDNQSNCSISPKTVTSPRLGMPAPEGGATEMWPEVQHINNAETQTTRRSDTVEKICTGSESRRPSNLTARPGLTHTISLPDLVGPASQQASWRLKNSHRTAAPRDTRMNVSSLLD